MKMSKIFLLALLILAPVCLSAQNPEGCTVLKLWPDGAPESNGLEGPETVMQGGRIGNISDPELLVFPAAEPNGLAVIMGPGGGYGYVAAEHEGTDMAGWFNGQGITFAVLKYRMPNGHSDIPLTDAQRASTPTSGGSRNWGSWAVLPEAFWPLPPPCIIRDVRGLISRYFCILSSLLRDA